MPRSRSVSSVFAQTAAAAMIFQSLFLFALALASSFAPTADAAKKSKADLEKVTSKVTPLSPPEE